MLRIFIAKVILTLLLHCQSFQNQKPIEYSYQQIYKKQYINGSGGIITLTTEANKNTAPNISSDGQFLIYSSNTNSNNDIFLRKLNDVNTVPFSLTTSNQFEPVLSPNGKYMAYIDDELDPGGDLIIERVYLESIYKKRLDLTDINPTSRFFSSRINLTNNEDRRVRSKESNPAWSSDSSLLAFSSNMTDLSEDTFGPPPGSIQNIWYMEFENPETLKQLTKLGGSMPAFSPDNQWIAYIDFSKPTSNGDIAVINLENKKKYFLTDTEALETNPVYSSDGKKVFFVQFKKDTNNDGLITSLDKGQLMKISFDKETFKASPAIPVIQKENIKEIRASNFLGQTLLVTFKQEESVNIALIPEAGVMPSRNNKDKQLKYFKERCPYSKPNDECKLFLYQLISEDNEFEINKSGLFSQYLEKYSTSGSPELYEFFNKSITQVEIKERPLDIAIYKQESEPEKKNNIKALLIEKAQDIKNLGFYKKAAESYLGAAILTEDIDESIDYTIEAIKADSQLQPSTLALLMLDGEKLNILEYLNQTYPKPKDDLPNPFASLIENASLKKSNIQNALMYFFYTKYQEDSNYLNIKDNSSPTISQLKKIISGKNLSTSQDFGITFLDFLAAFQAAKLNESTSASKSILIKALSKYSKDWSGINIESLVKRYIENQRASYINLRARNLFSEALKEQLALITFLTELREKETLPLKFNDVIESELESANASTLKAFRTNGDLNDILLKFYRKQLEKKGSSLEPSLYFARASYTLQLGIQINERLKLKKDITATDKDKSLKLFKIAETDFKWTYFIDPLYQDNTILLGYMYQYIDEQKNRVINEEGELEKDVFYSSYKKYFPQYLFERNIKIFKNTIRIFGNNKSNRIQRFYLNIGNNYFLLNNYQKAAEYYSRVQYNQKRLFDNEVQKAQFHFHYGKSLYFSSEYTTAIDQLLRSIKVYNSIFAKAKPKRNKRVSVIRKYLALCYDFQGKSDLAMEEYQKIIKEQGTNDPIILLELARLYIESGNPEEALSITRIADGSIRNKPPKEDNKLKVKIEWFGSYEPWTSILEAVFSLDPDTLVTGENRIIKNLSDLQLRQYSASLKAGLFQSIGQLEQSRSQLELLLSLSEKDMSSHGRNLYLNTLFRLAALNFQMGERKTSEIYYNEIIELSEDTLNSETYLKAAHNLAAVFSMNIENEKMSRAEKQESLENYKKRLINFQDTFYEIKIEAFLVEKQKSNPDLEILDSERRSIIEKATPELGALDIYLQNFEVYLFELKVLNYERTTNKRFSAFIAEKEVFLNDFLNTNSFFREKEEDLKTKTKYLPTIYYNQATLNKFIFSSKDSNQEKERIELLLDKSLVESRLAYYKRAEVKSLLASEINNESMEEKEKKLTELERLFSESMALRSDPVQIKSYLDKVGSKLNQEKSYVEHISIIETMRSRLILDQLANSPFAEKFAQLKEYAMLSKAADYYTTSIKKRKLRDQESIQLEDKLIIIQERIEALLKASARPKIDFYSPSSVYLTRTEVKDIIRKLGQRVLYITGPIKKKTIYLVADGKVTEVFPDKDIGTEDTINEIIQRYSIEVIIATGSLYLENFVKKANLPVFTSIANISSPGSFHYSGFKNAVEIKEPEGIFNLLNLTNLAAGNELTYYENIDDYRSDNFTAQTILYSPILQKNLTNPEQNSISILEFEPDRLLPANLFIKNPEDADPFLYNIYISTLEKVFFQQGAGIICMVGDSQPLKDAIQNNTFIDYTKDNNAVCAYQKWNSKSSILLNKTSEVDKLTSRLLQVRKDQENLSRYNSILNRLKTLSKYDRVEQEKVDLIEKIGIGEFTTPQNIDNYDQQDFQDILSFLLRNGDFNSAKSVFEIVFQDKSLSGRAMNFNALAEAHLIYSLENNKIVNSTFKYDPTVRDFFTGTPEVLVSNPYLLNLIINKLEIDLENVNTSEVDSRLKKILRSPNKKSAFAYIASLEGTSSQYVIKNSREEILIIEFLNDLIKDGDCSAGDFIAALSYAQTEDLIEFDESTINGLITNCSQSQELKLFLLTQLDLLSEDSYSEEILELVQTLRSENSSVTLRKKLDNWLEAKLQDDILFLNKISTAWISNSSSPIIKTMAKADQSIKVQGISKNIIPYLAAYYMEINDLDKLKTLLHPDQENNTQVSKGPFVTWGLYQVFEKNYIWKYNANQFSFEEFSANKIVEFPDSHILYVDNFQLKSNIKTQKLWNGPITYNLSINLKKKLLSGFKWQSNRTRGITEDYLMLMFGKQAEDKPDLFIADSLQQLKTKNAYIQIATCQQNELRMKGPAKKNQEIIMCLDKDSDEYLIEFLDMHLKNQTDLESFIKSFRKYNQARQKFFLLAS